MSSEWELDDGIKSIKSAWRREHTARSNLEKMLENTEAQNAKLRELVQDMGELLDVLTECDLACKHYHDGCIGDCYYVNERRELGVEVNQ